MKVINPLIKIYNKQFWEKMKNPRVDKEILKRQNLIITGSEGYKILKKWEGILLLFFLIGFTSCETGLDKVQSETSNTGFDTSFEILVIDSCEYLYDQKGYGGYLAHKGNCKNSIHKPEPVIIIKYDTLREYFMTTRTDCGDTICAHPQFMPFFL